MSVMVYEMLQDAPAQQAVIKVIGVGGGGCNAVNNMIDAGMKGVEFVAANTDADSLAQNRAPTRIQLGQTLTKGLGAGSKPEVGRNSALEDRERIGDVLKGCDMVFIAAGMGGGTGTGAAPVVAEVARELGVLTVAVVTRPFVFEGGKRLAVSVQGVDDLKKNVDSLIVIPNQKLMEVLGDDVTMREAFRAADDVLKGAVAGVAEVITTPGFVNVDFADVRTVMSLNGMAMMGTASASGIDRARVAAEQAVASPLLDDVTLIGAKGLLVNISPAPGCLRMREYSEIMEIITQLADGDADMKFGTAEVEGMPDDEIRVTLIATGLSPNSKKNAARDERPDYLKVVRTGTDDMPFEVPAAENDVSGFLKSGRRAVTTGADFANPAVMDNYDIPAFLRKQAD